MNRDLIDATDKVLKTILGRTWTDLVFRPSLVLVVIFSYIFYATYYIYRVHVSSLTSSNPDMLVGDTLILLIGSLVVVLIAVILMFGNTAHEKHESALRRDLIEYVRVRQDNDSSGVSSTLLELITIDKSIVDIKNRKKDTINLLFILGVAIVFVSLSLIPNLGLYQEIFMILNYTLTIGIAMIALPSLSTFLSDHEKGTVRFCNKLCEISDALRLGIAPLDLKTVDMPLKKYRLYTVATLGIFGIYWLTRIFAIRNKHYMEQWYFEDCLFMSLEEHMVNKIDLFDGDIRETIISSHKDA
ncbi:MAG: hypothetical protein KRP56_04890 [Candidatus Methanogranum gryphiswaldense]|nr:MAG: hypothetical protein KRP56_04890 [Candidatus Methanogranum sp. U3.2.1]